MQNLLLYRLKIQCDVVILLVAPTTLIGAKYLQCCILVLPPTEIVIEEAVL